MNHNYIEVQNLVKCFGKFVAVDNISFKVKKGEIFGFLGANGAGKTTVIRILCGLLAPSSGDCRIVGFDVNKESNKIKQNIGYMSQKFSLYEDLTVKENMSLFGGIYGMSDSNIKLKISEIVGELKLMKEQNMFVKSLPLGIKQKVAFAISIFHNPKIVFLDEPTGGVDPISRRRFWEMIYQTADRGITVFVTTHYLDESEYCKRVSIMVNGKIEVLDTPKRIKEQFSVKSMDEVFQLLAHNPQK